MQKLNNIIQKVQHIYNTLQFSQLEHTKGRNLAVDIPTILSYAILWHQLGIVTKKSVYELVEPPCSYKTFVVNINRFAWIALLILKLYTSKNREHQHSVKHTDSTDIPVCLNKNANRHKTMKFFATWAHNGKGYYYGLKLHITTDYESTLLSFLFTTANVKDKEAFMKLNKDLLGVFIADNAYMDKKLSQKFHIENQRILITKTRKNMKTISTPWQNILYDTRMLIEVNFRVLKLFKGLVTSIPRSVNGYLANYIYSLLAYCLA